MKNLRFLRYFPFLFVIIYTSVYSQEKIIKIELKENASLFIEEMKILKKENLLLDSLNTDSNEWAVIKLGNKPVNGHFWLFAELQITDSVASDRGLSINLTNIGTANEVFWDNKLIGGKGNFGEYVKKKSDSELRILKIPYNYAFKGTHQLLIRVFNEFPLSGSIEIGYYDFFMDKHFERKIEEKYIKIFFMAILFASAIFSLILFFGFNRNIAYLFFSIYCLVNSRRAYQLPFTMLENFESILALDSSSIGVIMYLLSNFSLLAYLITKFSFHKTKKFLSAIIFLLPLSAFIIPVGKLSESIYFVLVTILPFIIVLYAMYRKKEDSLYILIGLIGVNIFSYLGIAGLIWNGYYLGILFLVICILIFSSKEIARQSRQHREAVLRTARLENELLKRNIQPHFILNTLTSLQELIEQSPKKASELIHALADEFQMFSKVSSKKFIRISDELKLCNAHLRIMEYRKGTKYKLSVHGLDGNEQIPPGIFHTLIENGTTHGYGGKKSGIFSLKKENRDGYSRYIVFNDSENRDIQKETKKGSGLKYIEARLEESFPGLWKLSSRRISRGWEVIIDIFENEKRIK